MFQAHLFDVLNKYFGKREYFSIFLEDNNREPPLFEMRMLHICKTGVVTTFSSCCS